MSALDILLSLDQREQTAFRALFRGASLVWRTRSDTDAMPTTGKAECQVIQPWRDFWQRKLPELGLITFEESEPRATPGASFDSATTIYIGITPLGAEAYRDWMDRP